MSEEFPAKHGFLVERPIVLSVEAYSASAPTAEHAFWKVSVPTRLDDHFNYVVIATLHVSDDEGHSSVTVGGSFTALGDVGELGTDEFTEALKSSSALEIMYDLARHSMQVTCAVAEIELPIPPGLEPEMVSSEDLDAEGEIADAGDDPHIVSPA